MSGHSKWSRIKRKKGKLDEKRGRIFTRLIREITVSAREGGDESMNPRLRQAIANAKAENMPAVNIDRAIKRGTGELPGATYEEATYEGYGTGGVALLIEVLTDNKNRTVSEIRRLLSDGGGNLGEPGCVAWMFEKRGLLTVRADATDEETILTIAMEGGAQDVSLEGDTYEVITASKDFESVKQAFAEHEVPYEREELTMMPKTTVGVEGAGAKQVLRLLDMLEDHDDVQRVYANFDIDPAVMEEVATA